MSVQNYIEADQEKIRQLKRKYDLSKDADVLALFTALQSGEIQFESSEGRQFDDMFYEKASAIKDREKEIRRNAPGKSPAKSDRQIRKQT